MHTTAIRALGDEKAPFLNNSIVKSNSINALGAIVALGHHFTVDPNTTWRVTRGQKLSAPNVK